MSDPRINMSELNEALPGRDTSYAGRPETADDARKRAMDLGFGARVDQVYHREDTRRIARFTRCDYQATGEIGIVAPNVPELEKVLFNPDFLYGKGFHIDRLDRVPIEVIGENAVEPVDNFKDMGLHPVLLKTLALCHYDSPTMIQKYVIPAVVKLRDLVVSAPTGSGKTIAYLAPVISNLMGRAHQICAPKWNPLNYNPRVDYYCAEPLVLIVLPTRELAWQVFDDCRRMCYRSGLRPCVAYGGGPLPDQREELIKGCDVLIATPGRLRDFLRNPEQLSLSRVRYTVIDEADELLHDDWLEDFEEILGGGNLNEDADHVFMMFSATFPAKYRAVAKKYMGSDFLRIKAGRTGAAHSNVKQQVLWVDQDRKHEALYDTITANAPGRTIVFANSKMTANHVDRALHAAHLPSSALHGDLTQLEREDAMANFRSGKAPILVTTGVSARGIDVKEVVHVINFDLPSTMHGGIDEYVHRIGRTGRLGHEGLATSFYNERNDDIASDLVKTLIETNQPVPDFLGEFKPADGVLFEEDNSDDELELTPEAPLTNDDVGENGWGAGADSAANGFAGADDTNGFTTADESNGFKSEASGAW